MIMLTFKRIVLFYISVSFCQSATATIISTALTAEAYTLSYPKPDNGWRMFDSGSYFASTYTISNIYDTSVYASSYVEGNKRGTALLSMRKYAASVASGSATIGYQLENSSSIVQQFALRFSPLSGYLQAYCADPENLFFESNSVLPCIGEDFTVSSYNARITLNDELIWSSMAEVRSDSNGVGVVTDGAVLGVFDVEMHSYRWGTQWFELPLGVFEPNEQFNLVYSVDVLTDGVASLQGGATACEPYSCPYSDNIAFADYGFPQFDEYNDSLFQFSSSALAVNEPPKLGAILIGLLLLAGRLKKT
ncbi:hypothetical protein Patl_1098 [Paraglaciecola sp. T6c]|uniref:hypothetical protein n=1 Tax=Pseudoalteromonas atlantica (strain T6c / ATCC BAA-1087) TaxID=3042615 RepID=UPI00005C5A38|nr:hypothetical protein [Paraglaciecola sp. T6c]ABG39624.1 hypothetical protein Patl_1098 [Paraglaciecola sp. T6c]